MPEVNPPLYMSVNDVYTGAALALPWRDVMGEGVVAVGDLQVQAVAPAELAVNIVAGACWVTGDSSAAQGAYRCRSDSTVKLTIAPNASGQPRVDLVIAEVLDADFAGTLRKWQLRVVTGSVGAGVPALPVNAIPLAQVNVATGQATVQTANIVDVRQRAAVGGGGARDVATGFDSGDIKQVGYPVSAGSEPSGWLLCDGRAVSRATYAALFTKIGSTYGAGDGSSTFNLPDARGRDLVGAGTGSGLTARTLGAVLGEESHVISSAEMPSHSHGGGTGTDTPDHSHSGSTDTQGYHAHPSSDGGIYYGSGGTQMTTVSGGVGSFSIRQQGMGGAGSHAHNFSTGGASARHAHSIGAEGGGGAHNNMQPGLVVHVLIKT